VAQRISVIATTGRIWKKRLYIGGLCAFSAISAGVLLFQPDGTLAHWSAELVRDPYIRHMFARKNGATAIQAIGALIAFYGLGRAYIRAKWDVTVTEWILWRVFGCNPRGKGITVSPRSALLLRPELSATAYAQFPLDSSLPLQEQIIRLSRFVNDRSRDGAAIQVAINNLRRELSRAELATTGMRQEILGRIETEVKALNDKLDSKQVLDLGWAISGLFISFVGTVLSLGT